jgi:predicted acyl esterase
MIDRKKTLAIAYVLIFTAATIVIAIAVRPPKLVHELSVSADLRDTGETLRARLGNDLVVITPLPDGIIVEKDVMIRMPGGVSIAVNIYRPEGGGRVPVVLGLTSYGKDLKPEDYAINGRGPANRAMGTDFGDFIVSEETSFEAPDPAFWVPRGYAVVVADARGTGNSGGRRDPFSEKTVEDFARVVTWASSREWSNGRVGTVGTSYLAAIQWLVAVEKPEGLAAIIPWEGFTDLYRDVLFHGGIPETAFVQSWLAGPGGIIGSDDDPEYLARRPFARYLPLPLKPKSMLRYINGDNPTVEQMLNNINVPELREIDVPALIAGTWSMQGLHSRGAFNGYMEISSEEKWLYTHGRHEWTVMTSLEAQEYQAAFFDRYLKGEEDAMDGMSRVRLEVRTQGYDYYVRDEEDWPIPGTVYRPLYLDPIDRTLETEELREVALAQYNSTRDDELEFRYVFAEDTEITGHSSLRMWVSMDTGIDMDIFVALKKIDVDGKEVLFDNKHALVPIVSRGWIRASQRQLDPARSEAWRPYLLHDGALPVTPGERFPVDIEILPSSTFFEAGSSLALVIKGRDIVFQRTLEHKLLMNQGRHTVWAGGPYDTRLLIPVIPGGGPPQN